MTDDAAKLKQHMSRPFFPLGKRLFNQLNLFSAQNEKLAIETIQVKV